MTGKLSNSLKAALASLWISQEEPLSFTMIHKGLVKKGKVKFKMQTKRILDKAMGDGFVKKLNKLYYLTVTPNKFKVLDYLQNLADKKETTELQVGGWIWSLCQFYCVGMPKSVWKHQDVKAILQVFMVRIAMMFEALHKLALEIRRREIMSDVESHIPLETLREYLLELVPYYLGNKAGCDFNGLSLEDLLHVIPQMVESLPEEASPQSPTCKEHIIEHIQILSKIAQKERQQPIFDEEDKHFALVIIPPEDVADPDGFEKRSVKHLLEECVNESPLYIASELVAGYFSRENVEFMLNIYGSKLFGSKLNQIRGLYEKIFASHQISEIIQSFKFYDQETKKAALRIIKELTQKHGYKSIIKYLAFSPSGMNWFMPHQHKETLLHRFFPECSREAIHEWVNEGASLYQSILEEKEHKLRKMVENLQGNLPSF